VGVDLLNNDAVIDNKEFHPEPPPAPNIIPDDEDADSEAGRIEECPSETQNQNESALQPASIGNDAVQETQVAVTALAKSMKLGI
jgi:hypothetical protein